jgi:hypothetical protein
MRERGFEWFEPWTPIEGFAQVPELAELYKEVRIKQPDGDAYHAVAIDYVNEVEAWVNYIPPVVGTKEELAKIDPELASNELIVPSDQVLQGAHVFRGLTNEEEQQFSSAYADLTAS